MNQYELISLKSSVPTGQGTGEQHGATRTVKYGLHLVPVLLPHCPTAPLPHCPTVPLSYCPTAPLPHCPTAPLPHCPTVLLSYCPTAPLSYCPTAAAVAHKAP